VKKILVILLLVSCSLSAQMIQFLESSEIAVNDIKNKFNLSVERVIIGRLEDSVNSRQFFESIPAGGQKLFFIFSDSIDMDVFLYVPNKKEDDWILHASDTSNASNAMLRVQHGTPVMTKYIVVGWGETKNKIFSIVICGDREGDYDYSLESMSKAIMALKGKIKVLEKNGKQINYLEIGFVDSRRGSLNSHVLCETEEPFSIFVTSGSRIKSVDMSVQRWTGDSWIKRNVHTMHTNANSMECSFKNDLFKNSTTYDFKLSAASMFPSFHREAISFLLYK